MSDMTACLYVSLTSLSREREMQVAKLRTTLGRELSQPANAAYLDDLTGQNRRVAATRLAALALLPPLLTAAGELPCNAILSRHPTGRPYLHMPEGSRPMDFNLSHCDTHAVCALWIGAGQVGVDVETPLPEARAIRIAERYFSPGERDMMSILMTRDGLSMAEAFTRVWTVKEALCKQDGRGRPLTFDASVVPPALTIVSRTVGDAGAQMTICAPAAEGVTPLYV